MGDAEDEDIRWSLGEDVKGADTDLAANIVVKGALSKDVGPMVEEGGFGIAGVVGVSVRADSERAGQTEKVRAGRREMG